MTEENGTSGPTPRAREEDFVPTEAELEASILEFTESASRDDGVQGQNQGQNGAQNRVSINPVHVVLMKPIYPRNIGMCARAIANFGFQSLVIVAPQTEIGHEAKQGAAHAQKILREARVYPTLEAFYAREGEGLRIALSGKDARLKKSEMIEETLSQITKESQHPIQSSTYPVYLFFGAEDDGLSAEEMALCHHVCRIPTYSEVTSLNLSHAVLLTSFLVRRALESKPSSLVESKASEAVVPEPAYYLHESIHRWLELLGFDLSAPRVNIEKTLQRILLAQTPTAEELRTLNSVIHQTIRKLPKPE